MPSGPDLRNPHHRFMVVAGAGGVFLGEVAVGADASYRRHDAKPWTTSSSLDGRFARGLAGSQGAGDAYVAATLQVLAEDPSLFDADLEPRVALYRTFVGLWNC